MRRLAPARLLLACSAAAAGVRAASRRRSEAGPVRRPARVSRPARPRCGSAPGLPARRQPPGGAVDRPAAPRGRRARRRVQRPYRNVVGRDPRARARHGRRRRPPRHQGHPRVRRAPTTAPPGSPSCSSWRATCRGASTGPSIDLVFFDAEEAARRPAASTSTATRGSHQFVRYARRRRRAWLAAAGRDPRDGPVRHGRRLRPRDPPRGELRPRPLPAVRRRRATSRPAARAPFVGTAPPVLDDHIPFLAGGGPGGRPDRLRLRPGPAAGRVVAHAPRTTCDTSAPAAWTPSASRRSLRCPRSAERRHRTRRRSSVRRYPLGRWRPPPEPLPGAAPKRVLLAAPRGYCAGVDRAVQAVEQALELHGPPVYVRKEIVHNKHVVEQLAERGAIFVEEETEVPEGELVVFSAHGVAPTVHENARRARAAHDRRHLPAGDQGPRRGAQVRRAGLHDRPDRPRGPRGGRGDDRRGAGQHRPRADGRGRRRRSRSPIPTRSPTSPRRRCRSTRRPRSSPGCARSSPTSSARSPTTSVTRPPTARSPSSSSPASATWCW